MSYISSVKISIEQSIWNVNRYQLREMWHLTSAETLGVTVGRVVRAVCDQAEPLWSRTGGRNSFAVVTVTCWFCFGPVTTAPCCASLDSSKKQRAQLTEKTIALRSLGNGSNARQTTLVISFFARIHFCFKYSETIILV